MDDIETGSAAPLQAPLQIMSKPAMTWAEFWQGLLGIPESTAEEIARRVDAPRFFLIGRRRFIRTADARAWIDSTAAARPYFPRRNARGGA